MTPWHLKYSQYILSNNINLSIKQWEALLTVEFSSAPVPAFHTHVFLGQLHFVIIFEILRDFFKVLEKPKRQKYEIKLIDCFCFLLAQPSDSQYLWSHRICTRVRCWCWVLCHGPGRLSSIGPDWALGQGYCPPCPSYCFYTPPSAYWNADARHSTARRRIEKARQWVMEVNAGFTNTLSHNYNFINMFLHYYIFPLQVSGGRYNGSD